MNKKHEFCLGITHIIRDPGSVLNFGLSGHLSDLRVVSSYVENSQTISVAGLAEAVHGGILITGEISTSWKGECRRCLNNTAGMLTIEVRELYEREDQSLTAEDGETYIFRGDVLDLQEMVKDQILLGLPLAPLCKEDCAGICPECGTDLNAEMCRCAQAKVDPRWSLLDVLVDKDN